MCATPHFQIKQSSNLTLISHAGLALIGQCCEAAQIEAVIDPKLPVSKGMKTSDVVKSMVSLLCIGKSDYEAIEPFRDDRFFKRALNLKKVPGSVWLRQRIDEVAAKLRETTDEMSMRLLTRTNAPITLDGRFVCADMDTFVMDNSVTKKEEVGRTYCQYGVRIRLWRCLTESPWRQMLAICVSMVSTTGRNAGVTRKLLLAF